MGAKAKQRSVENADGDSRERQERGLILQTAHLGEVCSRNCRICTGRSFDGALGAIQGTLSGIGTGSGEALEEYQNY
jgi:hypothetical protein